MRGEEGRLFICSLPWMVESSLVGKSIIHLHPSTVHCHHITSLNRRLAIGNDVSTSFSLPHSLIFDVRMGVCLFSSLVRVALCSPDSTDCGYPLFFLY